MFFYQNFDFRSFFGQNFDFQLKFNFFTLCYEKHSQISVSKQIFLYKKKEILWKKLIFDVKNFVMEIFLLNLATLIFPLTMLTHNNCLRNNQVMGSDLQKYFLRFFEDFLFCYKKKRFFSSSFLRSKCADGYNI